MKHIYVIFFCTIFLFMQCKPKADEKDLQKVTELEDIISNIEDNLSIDNDEISGRLDSIKLMLNYLSTQKHDSGDVETKGAMLRYYGIQKNYEMYTQEYPVMMFDLDKYKAQVAKMKQDLQDGNLSKNMFEKQYQTCKKRLQNMDKKAAALSYNTYAVEGDYRRSHEKVKKLYDYVKSRNQ